MSQRGGFGRHGSSKQSRMRIKLSWSATLLAGSLLLREGHAQDAVRELPPLANVSWLEPITLSDGGTAYVAPPVGAREPRPLIVAVHGAGDRAEWACGGWRLAASEYAFVACPQGGKFDAQRFAWDSARTLERRVSATVQAVRARFGGYVADAPPIYVGFSQGATLSELALSERAAFSAVALAEGGYELLRDVAFLRRLRANGSERVLLVCGTKPCFERAHAAAQSFRTAQLELLSAGDARAGHNLNGAMQRALRTAWPEFVAPLPGWSGFARYLSLRAAINSRSEP